MQKNELIRLDARLVDVIDHAVFWGELENGHRFAAVAKGSVGCGFEGLKPPARVTVEFSPFDMSKGTVVGVAGERVENEGTKFSETDV